MNLQEIAKKLQKILNGEDSETTGMITNLPDFEFVVATNGFKLDSIADKKTGQNFIPVFIEFLNGSYDPIPNLKRSFYNVQIHIYYPVKFKTQFYEFEGTMRDIFVAKILDYGVSSGKCLSTLTPAEYGEMEELDMSQYEKWVSSIYKRPINKAMLWMSMTFTLMLTSCSKVDNNTHNLLYGNSVSYGLSFNVENARGSYCVVSTRTTGRVYTQEHLRDIGNDKVVDGVNYYAWTNSEDEEPLTYYTLDESWVITEQQVQEGYKQHFYAYNDGQMTIITPNRVYSLESSHEEYNHYYDENLIWVQSGAGMDNSPISQQLVDNDKFAHNISNVIKYNKTINFYVKDNDLGLELLDLYNKQELDRITNLVLTKKYKLPNGVEKTYTFDQISLSINENIAYGEMLSFTITFGDGE